MICFIFIAQARIWYDRPSRHSQVQGRIVELKIESLDELNQWPWITQAKMLVPDMLGVDSEEARCQLCSTCIAVEIVCRNFPVAVTFDETEKIWKNSNWIWPRLSIWLTESDVVEFLNFELWTLLTILEFPTNWAPNTQQTVQQASLCWHRTGQLWNSSDCSNKMLRDMFHMGTCYGLGQKSGPDLELGLR